MSFCTWTTVFEVIILPKLLLFLISHVFSLVLWFKAFYQMKSSLFLCFRFLWWWRKTTYVCTCWCRIMAEMVGEANVVLWFCHWYIFVDSIFLFFFFFNSGKLVPSHCMVSLSWENLGNSFTCPSYLISLEKYLVDYQGDKARQWEKGSNSLNSWLKN